MGKIGCIGFGSMGSALVKGFFSGGVELSELLVYDLNEGSQKRAKADGLYVATSISELAECETILLAVKPQNLLDVADIWPLHNNDKVIVISILAGVTIDQIKQALHVKKVARVMPNLPVKISKGVLAVNFSDAITDNERANLMKLLSKNGSVYLLEEKYFNTVTALSGSGPAFILLILEALTFGGVLEGLPADVALEMATNTMIGTAEFLKSEKLHPAKLKELVTSPSGTTAAGLLVLEEKGVRAALINAVSAATNRGKQLQEGK